MGIEQSRQWGVCTMNEFRKFLGLKRSCIFIVDIVLVADFSLSYRIRNIRRLESGPRNRGTIPPWVSSTRSTHCSFQGAARRVYGHVDNLELYVCLLIVPKGSIMMTVPLNRLVFKQNLRCR
jgi:hypothetical protein